MYKSETGMELALENVDRDGNYFENLGVSLKGDQ
jgi:hypothetical protein